MTTELLSRHAIDRPCALSVVDGSEKLTWKELDRRVGLFSGDLAARGVQSGDTVALILPNGSPFVRAFLAVSRIGAVAVPLSPDWTATEIREALELTRCRTLLAGDRWSSMCRRLVQDQVLDRLFLAEQEAVRESCGPVPSPTEDGPALALFTSGTTGRPKLVVRTSANLRALSSAYSATLGLTPDDRILCAIPMSHGQGFCSGLLASLASGATLVLQPRFERRDTLRLLERHRITFLSAVPFIFSVLADTPMPEPVDLSHLRLCVTGGAPLDRDTWVKVHDRLGLVLRQSYGSSETGVVTVNMDSDPEATADSVGRPIPGTRVEIWNDSGQPAPEDEEGDIAVSSASSASWSMSTARGDLPLEPTRLPDANGWIRTGDSGRIDREGRLYVTGRRRSFINVAGRKVNPAEIEAVLLSYPKVREAIVSPASSLLGGETVKATLVCREACTPEEVLEFCRGRLAEYKIPRFIEIRDEPGAAVLGFRGAANPGRV